MSAEFWTEFFESAGFEHAVATSYANIFFINKIQPSHLPDIDRDALKDMNITPMGDILTILKYIKISCAMVTTPTTISENEQPLLYRGDIWKPPVQLRNLQDSKDEYCGQNQFVYGAQHTTKIGEKSFLPKFSPSACQTRPLTSATATRDMRSAEIPAGYNLSTTTVVRESPLNLTVHGNLFSKKKIDSEHGDSQFLEILDCETNHDLLCNSINATVTCDTSETASHVYSISPDELEMGSDIDALKNNPDISINVSDFESCEWQQPFSHSAPVVPRTVLECNKPLITNCAPTTEETLPCKPLVQRSKLDCSENIVPDMTYIISTRNQRFSKEKDIIPGEETSYQKKSVFDRLGQRSNLEKVRVKTGFQQFRQNWQYRKELRLKSFSQRDNGVMRNNHFRKKWQYRPVNDDQINNNHKSAFTVAMGPEPIPEKCLCIQSKIYNEDTNKELISASHLNTDEIGLPKYTIVNSQKISEVVTNGNLSDAGTSNSGSNGICQENALQEVHSAQDLPNSLSSTILFTKPQGGKTLTSASDNVTHSHQEALTTGPGTVFMVHTSPCSSSLPNEDPELESLKNPALTRHTEQFYLAWTDRRKHAHSFPGLKPSFLEVSEEI